MTSPASQTHHYVIRRSGGKWVLSNSTTGTKIDRFTNKKQAIMTGRLLAGWRGTCIVVTK